jgi:hypothetical protein
LYWFGYSYITCENWLIRIPCIFFIKNNSPKYFFYMNRVYLVCVSVMRVLLRLIWDFLFFRNGIWFEINYVHNRYITFNLSIVKSINTNENIEIIFSLINFQGILSTKIFHRYIPRELQWEKKLKQSKKKWCHVIFTNEITDGINFVCKFVGKLSTLFIMSITKRITDGIFHRYFPENFRTVHFPIALLIVVLYEQNHWRIEKLSVLFGDFLKKFN